MAISIRAIRIILTVFLVFASLSPLTLLAVTDESLTSEEKAQILYDLDLFKGTNQAYFNPDLESEMDRSQAMVMIGRALGWDLSEDWDQNGSSGFTDVPAWAEPYVAYAVELDITYGIGGGLFGSGLEVTERQLKTWFDRALGRGDTWDDNAVYGDTTALTRAELVEETWDALTQAPEGQEHTLIETIIGSNEAMMEIALNGGLLGSGMSGTLDIQVSSANNFTSISSSLRPGNYYEGVIAEFYISGNDRDRIVSIKAELHDHSGNLMAVSTFIDTAVINPGTTSLFIVNSNDGLAGTSWSSGYPSVSVPPATVTLIVMDNNGNIYREVEDNFDDSLWASFFGDN